MPHLPTNITESAIFLYSSVAQAEQRSGGGGSGFLVGVSSEADRGQVHLYAVTNDHVATMAPVIRAKLTSGNVQIIPGSDSDWVRHPNGDDVAVRPLGLTQAVEERFSEFRTHLDHYWYFESARLMSAKDLQYGVGPVVGDECLMVGRYVTQSGKQLDGGVVRFGNLASYGEPIHQPERSHHQDSFLVDMRSMSGFSGSVVIIYFSQPGTISLYSSGGPQVPFRTLLSEWWILGVDWGNLWVRQKILQNNKSSFVKAESSLAAVVPAWKVHQLLREAPEIVERRQRVEAELLALSSDAAMDAESGSELERFDDLKQQIVTVPKAEIPPPTED